MVKDLRSFIGAVTYYRTMFPKRTHILAPLTALTSQKYGNVAWSAECQHAFDTIKAILSSDVLLHYPDHNKPFHVYTDASNLQLGAIIVQDDRPIAFYSRKLNAAQRNYTTMEKELLSIIETLKEFRMMLFGCRALHMWTDNKNLTYTMLNSQRMLNAAQHNYTTMEKEPLSVVETLKEFRTMLFGCRALHVWTDHKNLTYTMLNSQRVLHWRLFLEDIHPTFHYIPGDHNSLADTLSHLPTFGRQDPDAALALPPWKPCCVQSLIEPVKPLTPSRRPLLRLPPLSSAATPWPWITLLLLIVLSTYHLLEMFLCLSHSRPALQHRHKMPRFNRSS